ncbi:MAG: hypothetical protein H6732_05700 [Alphaproteobacteria bacterium]|nr:hypothetical protein [Alphaproteobacteria bacterium]
MIRPSALLPLLLLAVGAQASEPEQVSLSLEEFLKLYEAARVRPDKVRPPPRAHSLAQASYRGEVVVQDGEARSVRVDGRLRVEVHQDTGFLKLPLLSSDVALVSATVDGRPAALVLDDGAYSLVTDRKGAFEVQVRFAVPVTSQQGASSFGFALVPSGATTLSLSLPGADPLDVHVQGGRLQQVRVDGDHHVVEAALSSAARLAVSWQRDARPVGDQAAEEPRIYAQVDTLVRVGDGLVRTTSTVQHTILFAGVRRLAYDVPEGATVLDVRGSGLREWSVDADGDVVVDLNYAAESSYALTLDLEQVVGEGPLVTPLVRPEGAERVKGFVGVVADGGLEVAAGAVRGATPVDVRALPASIVGLTGQPVLLGFKYLGEGVSLPLAVTEHEQVEVLVTLLDQAEATTMFTEHGRRLTRVVWQVRNNRRQFLGVRLPEGATLWSAGVAGRAVQPAVAPEGELLLPLLRSASSGTGLSAFAVEVVYVEEGEAAHGRSRLQAALPRVDVPTNYVAWTLNAPAGSRIHAHTAGGDLRPVPALSRPVRADEAFVVQQEVEQTASAAQADVDAGALGTGAAPVRVSLPVTGPPIRFEKVLVLDEELAVGFEWSPGRG